MSAPTGGPSLVLSINSGQRVSTDGEERKKTKKTKKKNTSVMVMMRFA